MRVSSASFLADGAGGVARAHPAAGRFRRRLAVALYRRPAAAAAESRDRPGPGPRRRRGARTRSRSEEHTSELQSRLHLVCRLLLEKKKKKSITHSTKRVRNDGGEMDV